VDEQGVLLGTVLAHEVLDQIERAPDEGASA